MSNVEGEIQVNGCERNDRSFRKMSCYIMQCDELIPHLSVLEAVMFATNIKLGDRLTVKEKKALVFYFIFQNEIELFMETMSKGRGHFKYVGIKIG